jgi:hypothetical protein
MQTLRPPVTTTTRQPPTPVLLCFAAFASKPAWHAPFRVLPYFRGSFSLNRDRMSEKILRSDRRASKRRYQLHDLFMSLSFVTARTLRLVFSRRRWQPTTMATGPQLGIGAALIPIESAAPISSPSPETPRGWSRHYPNQLWLSIDLNRAAITNSVDCC